MFLEGSLVAVAGGCASVGRSKAAERGGACARIVAKDPAKFRILQVTDIHYFDKDNTPVNDGSLELIDAMLKQSSPDMVMITGDLWLNNDEGLGEQHMRYLIPRFEAWGIPWAYTWGNHDLMTDFSVGHKCFGEAKNSLYRGAETNGDYTIDVVTARGKRVGQLVCLNTGTQGMGEEQRAWLKKLAETDGEAVPRLAFFHIPLKQYATVWDSGAAAGLKGEGVCSEKEDGSSLALLKGLGVKACFCGHDHVNDYSGTMDGVELVYGRATGGYGREDVEKGGKVIDLNCEAGTYSWYSVTRSDAHWQPEPGKRVVVQRKK
jgi:3',5'-cyclic AMP phosphodiesterase CpdA